MPRRETAKRRTAVRDGSGSLVDVLDAGLRRGVAVRGDIVLSIADVDLVRIDLRALLASVDALGDAVDLSLDPDEGQRA